MNHLRFKLPKSQARRGQFASGLKIHVIPKRDLFKEITTTISAATSSVSTTARSTSTSTEAMKSAAPNLDKE